MDKKKKRRLERKEKIRKRKLIRKYWNMWYERVFSERNRIREMFILRFD